MSYLFVISCISDKKFGISNEKASVSFETLYFDQKTRYFKLKKSEIVAFSHIERKNTSSEIFQDNLGNKSKTLKKKQLKGNQSIILKDCAKNITRIKIFRAYFAHSERNTEYFENLKFRLKRRYRDNNHVWWLFFFFSYACTVTRRRNAEFRKLIIKSNSLVMILLQLIAIS